MFELNSEFKWQDIIDLIKKILDKIFGFIEKEEGWTEEAADETTGA